MLLDTLRGPLEHLYTLQRLDPETAEIDPEAVGATITDAFVVGLRNQLVASERPPMDLSHVGVLSWSADGLCFNPAEELRRPKPLLQDFVKGWESLLDPTSLRKAVLLDGLGLDELFSRKAGTYLYPFVGHQIIGSFCANLVRARMDRDPELAATLETLSKDEQERTRALQGLVEAICLLIHDSISCGPGLAIETIGIFGPGPEATFKIHEHLATLASARRRRESSQGQSRQPSVEFSWLK